MKNFYIGQHSTLPELTYSIPKTFFDKYSIDNDMLMQSVATFSLIDSDTGIFIIANSPAMFIINTDPYKISKQGRYLLKYRFERFDTTESGKYFGEFKLDILHPDFMGKITFPTTGKLNVFITPSITKTDVVFGDTLITTTTSEPITTPEPTTTPIPISDGMYLGYLTTSQGDFIDENIAKGVTYPTQVIEINPLENHNEFPDTVDCEWSDLFYEMSDFDEYVQFLAISKTILPTPYQYYENIDFNISKGLFSIVGSIESLTIDGDDYWVFKLNQTAPINYRLSINPL
jgi:hypothetical protein